MTTLFRGADSFSSDLAAGDFRYRMFGRLVGIALVAHVVGNWSQPDLPAPTGWANLTVGIVGLVLSAKPSHTWLLIGAGLTLVSLGLEIPFTGSHWMLAGLMAIATLVTLAYPGSLFPTVRWILLVFYALAAFAKLNTAFFDPTVSCSLFYANQSLQSLGLAPVPAFSPAGTAVVWGAALTEMSVPILLIAKRTRYWGVIVGTIFHGLISLDLGQHFYDFTAVLLPGFFLFLPDHSVEAIARFRNRMSPVIVQPIAQSWLLVGSILVLAAVSPLTVLTLSLLQAVPFVMWIPFLITWTWCLLAARNSSHTLDWKLKPLAAAVVGLTLLNGLTPYFEVKTAFSFNMYSNLLTAEGESNHIIIRRTLPLRDGHRDPIEILESSDPALEVYRSSGYLLPYPSFRRYLASNQDISVVFRRGDEIIEIDRASDRPELVDPGPWWWRFLPLRAIDQTRPPRCQSEFLPAL